MKKPQLGSSMNKSEIAMHNFNYWFNWHGHWIYSSKKSAFEAWVKHGIVDLNDAPNGIDFSDLPLFPPKVQA